MLICITSSVAQGFDDRSTHPALSLSGASRSTLDAALKQELGLFEGIDTSLQSSSGTARSVLNWLRTGSTLEDDPVCRAGNHFHNPLLPFSNSGVSDQPFYVRFGCLLSGFSAIHSSIRWGTGFTSPTQSGPTTGNAFDWNAARTAYLDALTLPSPVAREAALASTFDSLGHVIHLVQDLAVPAHVRNDFTSHLEYCRPSMSSIARWCHNSFEHFVRVHPELVDSAAATTVPTRDHLTRFWDTDRYNGTNPSTDLAQGLAEYTNANFVSQNTIFTESLAATDPHAFPFPRQSSTNLVELLSDGVTPTLVVEQNGSTSKGLYIRKTGDGEAFEHFLKAGFFTRLAIDSPPLRAFLSLTFQIDDVVMTEYAAKLLPRAIGYSAGLLDYFFRGKLDLDVVEDDSDPSVLRLVGTNASDDPLVDGTAKLYVDDATGLRTQATVLNPVAIASIEKGQALPELRFQAPADAERFVAVYQGTLGQEAKNDSQNNPGAVIGKVLGGVRVEEVFSDDQRWYLRTPQGVYPLPIPVAQAYYLHWGDQDNMLIALSAFDAEEPYQFSMYEIARPAGSTTVPLTIGPDGQPQVDAHLVKQVRFPFGLDLGTTVDLTATVDLRQFLPSFTVSRVLTYQPDENYLMTSEQITGTIDTAGASTTFHELLPLKLQQGTYDWDVYDFRLSSGGQLVALVGIYLLTNDESRELPLFKLQPSSIGLQVTTLPQTITVSPAIPLDDRVWVLLDVETGRILGSTAPTTITVNYTQPIDLVTANASNIFSDNAFGTLSTTYVGGPNDGVSVQEQLGLRSFFTCSDVPDQRVLGTIEKHSGYQGVVVTNLRADVASAAFSLKSTTYVNPKDGVVFCDPSTGKSAGFQITSKTGDFSPTEIAQAYLVESAGTSPAIALFMTQHALTDDSFQNLQGTARIGTWKPQENRVEVRQDFLQRAFHYLNSASSRAALVDSDVVPTSGPGASYSTSFLSLQGPLLSVVFPGETSSGRFVLLEPDLFYNIEDFKFYRKQAPLQRTVLPATLAPRNDNGNGDYYGSFHSVRVK